MAHDLRETLFRAIAKTKQWGTVSFGATTGNATEKHSLDRLWDAVPFKMERTAAEAAGDLHLEHWQNWAGAVRIPFPATWVSWQPKHIVRNPRDAAVGEHEWCPEVGALIVDNVAHFLLGPIPPHGSGVVAHVLPFALVLDRDRVGPPPKAGEEAEAQEFVESQVWGEGYRRVHGELPPFSIVPSVAALNGREVGKGHAGAEKERAIVREFAGVCSHLCASLALINAPKATELVQAGKTSTFVAGKVRRFPQTNLVVIRPDAIRRVYAESRKNIPANPKRLHDVREHLRRYKSGKVVVVRSHERGDETLGPKVQKRFIVERDPNTGLPGHGN
ncbi:MAG: hypothetical protein HC889_00580 [Synechococcaceae cyanobacterium SM1_2_3]|nr:hypothetical protein [Synechococcaceae cyanobacterium SM1_2_3]